MLWWTTNHLHWWWLHEFWPSIDQSAHLMFFFIMKTNYLTCWLVWLKDMRTKTRCKHNKNYCFSEKNIEYNELKGSQRKISPMRWNAVTKEFFWNMDIAITKSEMPSMILCVLMGFRQRLICTHAHTHKPCGQGHTHTFEYRRTNKFIQNCRCASLLSILSIPFRLKWIDDWYEHIVVIILIYGPNSMFLFSNRVLCQTNISTL